jgi:ribonuclease E
MPNKMLIDATHPEETRVVVLRGNRVEEFDFESASRKQLRGNIYLAKVTRVEPSLQAAFVDYGGNRHGFLAFSEIHPDYYQIPVADRQALIDEEERAARAADAEADHRAGRRAERDRERQAERHAGRRRDRVRSQPVETTDSESAEIEGEAMAAASEVMAPPAGEVEGRHDEVGEELPSEEPWTPAASTSDATAESIPEENTVAALAEASEIPVEPAPQPTDEPRSDRTDDGAAEGVAAAAGEAAADNATGDNAVGDPATSDNVTEVNGNGAGTEEETVESVGGADALEEVPERMYRPRRQYKIQEVIKRRQVMLVQVVKEERGTKGAALTTYLSLAGRYSVLMPNTARGGGISRKITSAEDRRRLKEIAQELEVPEGMGVILRTAGASRTKMEVKRDFEYLLRLWETVRDLTLRSTAPTLVYEEGSLVKRSIRDLYSKDIDEILVAGEGAYDEAREFMRMLMPSHAKGVKPFRDTLPMFTRFAIENQLDAMFQPVVQLRSGGYIVLNQTEALVAIDVNSGRATREHHIEDTALKTNLEAADEIARQLRLRDLAGLIVIDFIDMDEKRNNRTVERRLKEALRHDRARIQVGHISHFGLLEMSRQRIRSSVLESSTDKCPHCGGSGHVRSVSSVALQLLRSLEETLLKGATHNIIVRTRSEIALYLLNQKRAHLRALEERFQVAVVVNADASIAGQLSYLIEKGEQVHSIEQARAIAIQPTTVAPVTEESDEDVLEAEVDEEEADDESEGEDEEEARQAGGEPMHGQTHGETHGEEPGGGRARRRRRRRGRRGGGGEQREPRAPSEQPVAPIMVHGEGQADSVQDATPTEAAHVAAHADGGGDNGGDDDAPGTEARGDGDRRRRRRGRRGGRRNRRDRETGVPPSSDGAPMEANAEANAEIDSETGPAFEHEAEPPQPFQPQTSEHLAAPVAEAPPREPPPPASAPTPVEAGPSEATRRRSTVRERAPISVGREDSATHEPVASPSEPPQPVVVSPTEGDDSDRPRRSGWWSRRMLGKD